MRDGDGWTVCGLGHQHWGTHGAAGLLLVAPGPHVLLQHRAVWSHHGDTWGLPGGARGSSETAVETALREATEETGLDTTTVEVTETYVDDHEGWTYTTVIATARACLEVHALDRESQDVRWVPTTSVAELVLHPGFAGTWPVLQPRL